MLKGALIGFGISILLLMIPIVHFVAGPIGPFIGGFVGGGVARATPGRAVGIGLLMGLFMAGPAILLALLAQTLSLSDKAQDIFTYVAIGIVFWAGLLGTLGALVGGRSHGRVVVVRRRRWG
ncbi:MAG: hypothetical protein O7E55_09315 [Chloroflexi bacterium]|nr:hypothetical protein [Chloroflexota bacterium]